MTSDIDFAFLDSGTGGIPYMHALKEKCPSAKCVYIGDTKNFPYGEKTREQVIECCSKEVESIIKTFSPKTIVIACNTISVTALDELRKRFPEVPFVGTVPAIRLAAKTTKNKRIGFLATNVTVNHPYSLKLIEDFASDCKVFSRGDPDLIEFIELHYFTATKEERMAAIKPALDYFAQNDCDTIILGCTHFTHVANEFIEAAAPNVSIIDSREGVSRQAIKVEQIMEEAEGSGVVHEKTNVKDMTFYVTKLEGKEDEKEYKLLCQYFNIPWGGELK